MKNGQGTEQIIQNPHVKEMEDGTKVIPAGNTIITSLDKIIK